MLKLVGLASRHPAMAECHLVGYSCSWQKAQETWKTERKMETELVFQERNQTPFHLVWS